MNWFVFALLSAVVWGTENFFHKYAAKNGYDSNKVSGIMGLTASIWSILVFLLSKEQLVNIPFLLFIGLLNSVTFFSSFITRLESLKTISASVFFPASRIGSLLVLVALSILTLHEQLSPLHWTGLGISFAAIYLLTTKQRKKGEKRTVLHKAGLLFMLASTIFAALANYTADLATVQTGTYAFVFVSYFIGIPFSYLVGKITHKRTEHTVQVRSGSRFYFIAGTIGSLNLLGFVFFLLALKSGPLSLVGAINSFSILLTIVLSIVIYKEKPGLREIMGIVLSFVALLLFRF